MTLDDLKAAWKAEIDQPLRTPDLPMAAIVNEMAQTHRSTRFRDFCMILSMTVASILYLVFGWLTREGVSWLSRLSVVGFVAATVLMSVTLLRARRVARTDDWTIRSRLETEIERLEKQQRLMNRVGYWFLLPMLCVNGLSLLGGYGAQGTPASGAAGAALFAGCAALYGFTYWFVRRQIAKEWNPLLARLRGVLRDLLRG